MKISFPQDIIKNSNMCYTIFQKTIFKKNPKNKTGFTLIELLVVISIIGLLSTIGMVSLNSARQKARDVRRIADVRQIRMALELYLSNQETYPVVPRGLEPYVLGSPNARVLCDSENGFVSSVASCTGKVYITNIPENPTPGGSPYTYLSVSRDAQFQCLAAPCQNYAIEFALEKETAQLKQGAHCSFQTGVEEGQCPRPL